MPLAEPSLAGHEEVPVITSHLNGYSAMTPPHYSPPSLPSYFPSVDCSSSWDKTVDVNDGPDFFLDRYQPISSVMDFDTAVSEMFWIPK